MQDLLPSESVIRETIPSAPPEELLDTFTELSGYNQSEPKELVNDEEKSSSHLLIISNAEYREMIKRFRRSKKA